MRRACTKKRLITYPRTDSRFLTEDMAESLPGLASGTAAIFGAEEKLLVHVQQVINGSKVTDHHALLPTASVARADLSALPAGERNVLRLIATRLLCAVGEPYRYAETVLTTICAGEEFSAKGKVVLDEGWKSIERRVLGDLLSKKKEPAALPDVQRQSRCSIAGAELKEGQTSPPKHYNEDLLLSAMQSAGADSMEDDVERTGIGTPATRAATIEKLVQKGFLERKGDRKSKILLPTEKGRALVTVMPEQIQSPEMTADWENKLLRIERSEMEPEEFMTEIKEMVSSLVNTTEAVKGANALMRYLEKQNIAPSIDNYEILYRGNLPTGKRSVPQPELLEQLYQKFNCAQPMDYHGHSLSVSDVILLNQAGKISAHYVDSIGFRELSGFQDKQERSSVLSQLKAKCDMPECNPTKCRKGRNDHAI